MTHPLQEPDSDSHDQVKSVFTNYCMVQTTLFPCKFISSAPPWCKSKRSGISTRTMERCVGWTVARKLTTYSYILTSQIALGLVYDFSNLNKPFWFARGGGGLSGVGYDHKFTMEYVCISSTHIALLSFRICIHCAAELPILTIQSSYLVVW